LADMRGVSYLGVSSQGAEAQAAVILLYEIQYPETGDVDDIFYIFPFPGPQGYEQVCAPGQHPSGTLELSQQFQGFLQSAGPVKVKF